MKVNRESFYKILDTVKVGLSRNKSLESMLYFQFTGNTIMAYNNQILITYRFKSDIKCFVHADKLMKAVSKLKGEFIDISFENDTFVIKAKGVQLKLNTISDQEIMDRTRSVAKDLKSCKWNDIPENFIECAKLCQFAASKNESDNTLICLNIQKDTMIASDNNRIAKANLSTEMKDMLIKAEFVSTIAGLDLSKYDTTKSWIHFKGSDNKFILSIRKIEGNYPDFTEIMKVNSDNVIELPKNVLDVLDISEIFIDEFNSSVNLNMKKGMCFITTKSDSGSMQSKFKIDYSGDELSFSVSPVFLMKMLTHSSSIHHDEDKISIVNDNFVIVTALFGD